MIKKFLPILIFLSALAVSGSAAFYSVFGLSKLFAGASTQVIIMAASLEFAKLVVASFLHHYWSKLNNFLKSYLVLAVFVLMLITSGGIYGYLSSAYQETATKDKLLTEQITLLEYKKERFENKRIELLRDKDYLTENISDLRSSLSNPSQVQYVDRVTGQLITTTSSSIRKSLEGELKTVITERDSTILVIQSVTDSLTSIETKILEQTIGNENSSELGPLKYLSEVTGKPMSTIVNWFLLLIIFVFDPLAISMVVAANVALTKSSSVSGEQKVEVLQPEDMITQPQINLKSDTLIEDNEDIDQPREIVYNKRNL